MSQDDVLEIVKSFLDQDADWHGGAEPMIAAARRDAVRELPPGTKELATSASKEVKAMSLAWRGSYRAASTAAVEAAQALTHSSVASYRAALAVPRIRVAAGRS